MRTYQNLSPLASLGRRLGVLPIINVFLYCGCMWAALQFAPHRITGLVGIIGIALFPLYTAATCVLLAAYIAAKDELSPKRHGDG